MATPLITYVEIPAETFHREAAVLAYRGFSQEGFGLVVADFKEADSSDEVVRATLRYQPFDPEDPLIDSEVLELMDAYDPFSQYVLAVPLQHGGVFCGIVPHDLIGMAPREAYIQWVKRGLPLVSGTLVRLQQPVGVIQAGYYVYTGQQRAMMVLAPAVMEDEGDLVPGERRVELHMDFRELLDLICPAG